MKTTKIDSKRLVVSLDPGDEIVGSIELAATEQGWPNALVHGIGSVENPLLAHYRLDHKKYTQKRLAGIFEITGLQGNIALFETKPLVHVHVAISDAEMTAYGGHLVEGNCSAAAELIITKLDSKLTKSQNDRVGLKTWDLEKT